MTSIHDRYPDVEITIHNTSVQGRDAMASMMEAISILDDDPAIDVIVLTRGGGADKHLRVFNETPLCRVIHGTDTPIVVGVGHENDRSLADEVADSRTQSRDRAVSTPRDRPRRPRPARHWTGRFHHPHPIAMTDTTDTISEKTDRLDYRTTRRRRVSLERANNLHEEGKELLAKLEEQLDVGDGDVVD
ncbi:Exonuclease VII large subunit [Halomicrobium sp. LC1Hm]|nr:Exonuclease VII large subunit [Halomicrobium sp. LC1Hm]